MISFLRKVRKKQHMSIKTLSELSGVCARTIGNWEYGGVIPPIDKFNKVLNALGYELIITKKGEAT